MVVRRSTKNIDRNNAIEIYDLKEDEGERNNLALVNKKKLDELQADLFGQIKGQKVPMPVKI